MAVPPELHPRFLRRGVRVPCRFPQLATMRRETESFTQPAKRRGTKRLPVNICTDFVVLIERRVVTRIMPRSGRDFDGRTSSISLLTRSSSPGRTGSGQLNWSKPTPRMPPAGLNSPSTISRMVIAAVCQPLAASPLNGDLQRRVFVEMIGLRIELFGEGDDLFLVDALAAGQINLPDGVIFQILLLSSCRPRSRVNHAPPATAAALIRPNVASATDSAIKTAVRSPVQRSASQPPNAAMTQARNVGEQRPQQAAGALRGKIERHAEPEQAIGRADHVQIARAGIEHRRIGVEQRQPGERKRGGAEPDELAERGGDGGADPGHAQARSRRPAPILVPTMATSGPPRPNTSGISKYSRREPVP